MVNLMILKKVTFLAKVDSKFIFRNVKMFFSTKYWKTNPKKTTKTKTSHFPECRDSQIEFCFCFQRSSALLLIFLVGPSLSFSIFGFGKSGNSDPVSVDRSNRPPPTVPARKSGEIEKEDRHRDWETDKSTSRRTEKNVERNRKLSVKNEDQI